MPESNCTCEICVNNRMRGEDVVRLEETMQNPRLADRKKLAKAEISSPDMPCIICGNRIGDNGKIAYAFQRDSISGDWDYRPYHICEEHYEELTAKCECCGIPMIKDYGYFLLNGEGQKVDYCPRCYRNRQSFRCGFCGNSFDASAERIDHDGITCCKECFKENAKKCLLCGQVKLQHYEIKVPGETEYEYVCNRCANNAGGIGRCDGCGEAYLFKDLSDLHGEYYCPDCEENLYETCEHCGGENYTPRPFCRECSTRRIRGHDYQTPAIGVGEKPWYGLELEVTGFESDQIKTDVSAAIWRESNDERIVYQVHDGTTNGGFELCFHPRSVDKWFDEEGKNILHKFASIVREYGGYSYKGGYCGVHFHRCLVGLKHQKDRTKLLRAIIALEPFLYILAQRTGVSAVGVDNVGPPRQRYGAFDMIKQIVGEHEIGPLEPEIWEELMSKKQIHREVEGINFGRHRLPTAEIRIFRGTLKVSTILAYLALYHELVNWSFSVDLKGLLGWNYSTAWREFIEFVKTENTEWSSHLLEYAMTKGVYV